MKWERSPQQKEGVMRMSAKPSEPPHHQLLQIATDLSMQRWEGHLFKCDFKTWCNFSEEQDNLPLTVRVHCAVDEYIPEQCLIDALWILTNRSLVSLLSASIKSLKESALRERSCHRKIGYHSTSKLVLGFLSTGFGFGLACLPSLW